MADGLSAISCHQISHEIHQMNRFSPLHEIWTLFVLWMIYSSPCLSHDSYSHDFRAIFAAGARFKWWVCQYQYIFSIILWTKDWFLLDFQVFGPCCPCHPFCSYGSTAPLFHDVDQSTALYLLLGLAPEKRSESARLSTFRTRSVFKLLYWIKLMRDSSIKLKSSSFLPFLHISALLVWHKLYYPRRYKSSTWSLSFLSGSSVRTLLSGARSMCSVRIGWNN